MPVDRQSGLKAARTNMQRYGANFYSVIGRRGGSKSRGGGFAYMAKKDPDRLKELSSKGGKNSKRVY